MVAEGHEVAFTWPHPEPNEVIISGTFNDWSRNDHLTKGPKGFSGKVHVPWGQKTLYKFIVDGTWMTSPDQPIETDHDGNLNNVYTPPPPSTHSEKKKRKNKKKKSKKPRAAGSSGGDHGSDRSKDSDSEDAVVNGNGKQPVAHNSTGDPTSMATIPQLVADVAGTLAALEGTSSAFDYVTSGIGAAIHSVVGVDPVNADQIAIPTPLQTAATATSEFDAPGSATSAASGAPTSATTDGPLSAAVDAPVYAKADINSPSFASTKVTGTSTSDEVESKLESKLAPVVPLLAPSVNEQDADSSLNLPETPEPIAEGSPLEERSTHTPISVNGGAPVVGTMGDLRKAESAITMDTAKISVSPERVEATDPTVVELESTPAENQHTDKQEPTEASAPAFIEAEQKTTSEPEPAPATEPISPPAVDRSATFNTDVVPAELSETGESQVHTVDSDLKLLSVTTEDHKSEPPVVADTTTGDGTKEVNPVAVPAGAVEAESVVSATRAVNADDDQKVSSSPPEAEPTLVAAPGTDGLATLHAPAVETTLKETYIEEPGTQTGKVAELISQNSPVATEAVEALGVNGHATNTTPQQGAASAQAPPPSTPIQTPATKEADKPKEAFPSAGDSPSSSRTGTQASRKKKTSFFGKLKHLFDSDKEKAKRRTKNKGEGD